MLDGINGRLHTAGEKISELEKDSIETIQNETDSSIYYTEMKTCIQEKAVRKCSWQFHW